MIIGNLTLSTPQVEYFLHSLSLSIYNGVNLIFMHDSKITAP